MSRTEVLFLNHASVLVKYDGEFLLCDPWFETPAFGSWLPVPALFCHPTYLSALGDKLRILISHAHDDHCDNAFLKLFDSGTHVFSSDYPSHSVKKRVARSGLRQFQTADRHGVRTGPFEIRSFRSENYSTEDALYTIRTPDALIVHCNDLWNAMEPDVENALREQVRLAGSNNTLYMTQTNSSSGFPLTYQNFSPEEKQAQLEKKVERMITQGLTNAATVGARYFLSYAGFAGIFVKDKPEYNALNLFPTPHFIERRCRHAIPETLKILDMLPGDVFDFESVRPSFFRESLQWERWKKACDDYYELSGVTTNCGAFTPTEQLPSPTRGELQGFLSEFDSFAVERATKTGFHKTILGKTFGIEIADDSVTASVCFGDGVSDSIEECDKVMRVSGTNMTAVIRGQMLFEGLYTGYLAEFRRKSIESYNRDIISYLVLFSYHYKAKHSKA